MLTMNSFSTVSSQSMFRFSQKPKIEWILSKLLFLIIVDLDLFSVKPF